MTDPQFAIGDRVRVLVGCHADKKGIVCGLEIDDLMHIGVRIADSKWIVTWYEPNEIEKVAKGESR